MQTYDFISKRITEAQVKSIITKAGYNAADCKYTPRVDGDGFLAQGNVTMSLTALRNAARNDVETSRCKSSWRGLALRAAARRARMVTAISMPTSIRLTRGT